MSVDWENYYLQKFHTMESNFQIRSNTSQNANKIILTSRMVDAKDGNTGDPEQLKYS